VKSPDRAGLSFGVTPPPAPTIMPRIETGGGTDMTDADTVHMTLEEAVALARRVLIAHGCDEINAAAVAANMAAAERDTARSHGLFRLPNHVRHLQEGAANGTARPRLGREPFAPLRARRGYSSPTGFRRSSSS